MGTGYTTVFEELSAISQSEIYRMQKAIHFELPFCLCPGLNKVQTVLLKILNLFYRYEMKYPSDYDYLNREFNF